MCGIAGALAFRGSSIHPSRIEKITNALSHRGKDSFAYLHSQSKPPFSDYPGVALGHRRLSVLDLSKTADQPMRSLYSRNVLVYNGELYNFHELQNELKNHGYTFRTKSDTEVVLAAYDTWGEACLKRFDGMYAFAVWNEKEKSFFCARDPIGIKPFYYTLNQKEFLFASESRALKKESHNALNREAVICYLLSMYIPSELSIFENIKKLLPGHTLKVRSDGRAFTTSFWSLPREEQDKTTLEQASEILLTAIDSAVQKQLQSDVPVGILLSGGFDSGMILASAKKNNVQLHSYSVGFSSDQKKSELSLAAKLARQCGTRHYQRELKDSEIIPILNTALTNLSEPVSDSAMVPTHVLSEMASRNGVKVLLSGTGGDEVFGGYTRYAASSLRRRVLHHMSPDLKKWLGKGILKNTELGARLKHSSLDMMFHTGGSPKLARYLFSSNHEYASFLEKIAITFFPKPSPHNNETYSQMNFDLQVYLPDLLLMLLDQMTMANTVEGRVPLLDLKVIRAARSLPAHFHINPKRSETRRLLKEMAKARLPQDYLSRQKIGFSGPFESWITKNKQVFKNTIFSEVRNPIMEEMPLEKIWSEGIKKPSRQWANNIFSLYCFAIWRQQIGH